MSDKPETKTETKKKDGFNYKGEITQKPERKTGAKSDYVKARMNTTIRGEEKEITLMAFENKNKDTGEVSPKSVEAMNALEAKKVGDKINVFGRPQSREIHKEGQEKPDRASYFQVLAVDKQPVKKKDAPEQEGPEQEGPQPS